MHSIELLFDDKTDRAIRAEWQVLVDAGLPSQGRHTGATNAPHVTLLARARLDDSHDDELAVAMRVLPLRADLSGLAVFGGLPRGLVLARAVVQTSPIRSLHRAVHDAAPAPRAASPKTETETEGAPDREVDHTLPDRWTPHVTLASRLSPQQLADAVAALGGCPPLDASFAAGRRWNSDERTVTSL